MDKVSELMVSYIVRLNGKFQGSIEYLDPQGNEITGEGESNGDN